MEHFGLLPDLLRSVDKLPGLPGARRARAVVEYTRKPSGLPRPERRGHLRACTPAPAGGEWGRQISERPRRYTHSSTKKPNQKKIRFGFCFALIFNTYASEDFRNNTKHQKVCKICYFYTVQSYCYIIYSGLFGDIGIDNFHTSNTFQPYTTNK